MMLPIFDVASSAARRTLRTQNRLIPRLRGDDLLLHATQNLLRLVQRQPRPRNSPRSMTLTSRPSVPVSTNRKTHPIPVVPTSTNLGLNSLGLPIASSTLGRPRRGRRIGGRQRMTAAFDAVRTAGRRPAIPEIQGGNPRRSLIGSCVPLAMRPRRRTGGVGVACLHSRVRHGRPCRRVGLPMVGVGRNIRAVGRDKFHRLVVREEQRQ